MLPVQRATWILSDPKPTLPTKEHENQIHQEIESATGALPGSPVL